MNQNGCFDYYFLQCNDLTMFDELFKLSQVQNQSQPQIKVVTHAEVKRRRENDEINEVLDRKDGSQPVSYELDEQTLSKSPSECPDLSEPMDDKSDMVDVIGDGEEVHVRENAEEECREEEREEVEI